MAENNTHDGNYKATTNMMAENQDMAFVNDTLEEAEETQNKRNRKVGEKHEGQE